MAAKQLMLPANRAFNSNGIGVPGATAELYLSGGLTPANFYFDEALTVSLGTKITANGAGRFTPLPYQDESVAFRLITKDAAGGQLDDIDPFYFGSSVWGIITGAAGVAAGSRSLLAGIAGTAGQFATLTESGREGSFVFSSANHSADVTADPQQGIYVAPASETTGASGAWVRKFDGPTNIRWFGDLSTSASALTAFNAAVTLIGSLGTLYNPRGSALDLSTITLANGVMVFDAASQRIIASTVGLGKSALNGSGSLMVKNAKATSATRVLQQPNGYPSGTQSKYDWMFDEFDLDGITVGYRLINRFTFAPRDGSSPYGGVAIDSVKGTGRYFGIYPVWVKGFSDGGACAEADFYVDFSDPNPWRTPYKEAWRTGIAYNTGDYVTASNHLYQATTTGTSGAAIPSHTTGTVSDGGVSWLFVRDFSGSTSNHIKPVKVFGSHHVDLVTPSSSTFDNPKLGTALEGIPAQYARGVVFWNGSPAYFLDNNNAIAWKISTHSLTGELFIESADGTKFARFGSSFIQLQGLSLLPAVKTLVDADVVSGVINVTGLGIVVLNFTSPQTITGITGTARQPILIQATNGNATLTNNANIKTTTSANKVLTANSCLSFSADGGGTIWTEHGKL